MNAAYSNERRFKSRKGARTVHRECSFFAARRFLSVAVDVVVMPSALVRYIVSRLLRPHLHNSSGCFVAQIIACALFSAMLSNAALHPVRKTMITQLPGLRTVMCTRAFNNSSH